MCVFGTPVNECKAKTDEPIKIPLGTDLHGPVRHLATAMDRSVRAAAAAMRPVATITVAACCNTVRLP